MLPKMLFFESGGADGSKTWHSPAKVSTATAAQRLPPDDHLGIDTSLPLVKSYEGGPGLANPKA
jgi:hypothetical protein